MAGSPKFGPSPELNEVGFDGSGSYVMAWPGGERVLEADDSFILTDSSLVGAAILDDASSGIADSLQDSLLDALSRLQEEKQRSARLQMIFA